MTVAAAVVGVTVAGCGREDSQRVVRTVTVTSPSEDPATPPRAAGAALPAKGGDLTIQGRYRMVFRGWSPAGRNLEREPTGQDTSWTGRTNCGGGRCRVQLRRQLASGGYKNYALRPEGSRRFGGSSSGTIACGAAYVAARQRISIEVTGVAVGAGRPRATEIDVRLHWNGGCEREARGAVFRWRGALIRG